MSVQLRTSIAGLFFGLLLLNAHRSEADDAKPAKNAKAASEGEKSDVEKAAPKLLPKAQKTLSPVLVPLRDRVRKTLAALKQQPFNTQQNSCTEVLHFCHAFGCDGQIGNYSSPGQKVNGITCLCWNMPCGGNEPLIVSEGHLTARIGYGYQDHPSQLAAILALAHVPAEYPARSGETVRTVADLIEYEKLTCRAVTDMSLKLVALANYVREPSWKNNLGEEWTLERVVAEELNRPVGSLPQGATNRLLGLSCALAYVNLQKKPPTGDMARAKQYVDESIDFAMRSQNTDGSWGRPTNRDSSTAVSMTGHMLNWLLVALPDRRLEDAEIVRAVDFLCNTFNSQHYQQYYIPTMTTREIAAAMEGAHALSAYDERVFVPCDPPPAEPAAKSAKTAAATATR